MTNNQTAMTCKALSDLQCMHDHQYRAVVIISPKAKSQLFYDMDRVGFDSKPYRCGKCKEIAGIEIVTSSYLRLTGTIRTCMYLCDDKVIPFEIDEAFPDWTTSTESQT